MMNGHNSAADITQSEWDHYRGRVIRHDAELSELTGIPETVRGMQAIQRAMADDQARIRVIVEELAEWKDDSKVQYIHELRGRVHGFEAREAEAIKERERDRLDLKRTIRAAIITAVVAVLVGWGFAKLTAPPPISPVTQGAKQP